MAVRPQMCIIGVRLQTDFFNTQFFLNEPRKGTEKQRSVQKASKWSNLHVSVGERWFDSTLHTTFRKLLWSIISIRILPMNTE